MKPIEKASDLRQVLESQKTLLKKALFFSFFIKIFALAPVIYMFQVYDRVVNSRSAATLAMLTLLIVVVYIVSVILEWVRAGILRQAGLSFDRKIRERIFETVFEARLKGINGTGSQMFNDLRIVREFISGSMVRAGMDIPFALAYLIIVFYINYVVGMGAVFVALMLVGAAFLTKRSAEPPLAVAGRSEGLARGYADNALRNAEVIEAMGMLGSIYRRWLRHQNIANVAQLTANEQAGKYHALAKFLQTAQGSLLLGLGCWYLISVDTLSALGAGGLLVASILGGQAVEPFVQLIGGWKNIARVRVAYSRIESALEAVSLRMPGMSLPPPTGQISAEGVVAAAPNGSVPILRGVSFKVPAGDVVAIVGPAASGKSTLARLLVGVWPAANGKIRLDGVDVHSWSKGELGPYLGYLPQDVQLFQGTLADNIARFGDIDMIRVEEASRAIGLHEFIASLPDGYKTNVGDEGCFLSGGQRQRVGLARAIYGNPRLVVLDEPNSSLDDDGEQALLQTLSNLKKQGTTVIVVTHRTSILSVVDSMLVLFEGQIKAYGPRDEVMTMLQRTSAVSPSNK